LRCASEPETSMNDYCNNSDGQSVNIMISPNAPTLTGYMHHVESS
jgi:hypothetical protein